MTPNFSTLLAAAARRSPGRPLVTYYEGADVRVELSVATYANWVAKLANLLVDEADVNRGDSVQIDLEPHWLGAALLGAAWSVGAQVETVPGESRVLVRSLARHEAAGGDVPDGIDWYAVTALHPLGLRVPTPLPATVVDLGVEVWGQPDAFAPFDPPDTAEPALDGVSFEALVERAGHRTEEQSPLTTHNPVSLDGAVEVLAAVVGESAMVLLRDVTAHREGEIRAMETPGR